MELSYDITKTAEYRVGQASAYLQAILDTGDPRAVALARAGLEAIGHEPIGHAEIGRRLAGLP